MSTISILLILVALGCLGWSFKTKDESTKTVCVIAFLVFFIWGITMIGTEQKPKEPKHDAIVVYEEETEDEEEPEDEEPVYEKYLQVEPEREEHEDTLVVPRGGLTEEQRYR